MVCAREVAVAIPIQVNRQTSNGDNDIRIHLVTSRKHDNRYVLPKGGVEHNETSRQAAVRELWEEAGLVGESSPSNILSKASQAELTVDDHKPHRNSPSKSPQEPNFVPRARYTGHQVLVTSIKDEWPESDERQRKLVTIQEAEKQLEWRKDIHTIFTRWAAGISRET
ncbi:related to diadenosine hexaphosphate (Ap6A) hydrolase [Melanopsichium pennsylvanicum]|uniref:Related to diadenosine hexaphosphate (Ap6A) hydrolase n=1 Tax=Melanopsichium pennsylvanicum TaxID=63383 RepID=A0AAJ4XHY2_9BASI|nr:related to diadenosine hexaphosphate (Ap6A) hydrolase [Melanopsichium pennsylvanicum]